MFYATLLICLMGVVCDIDHLENVVLPPEQSPPIFGTEEDCHEGAVSMIFAHGEAGDLRKGVEYQFDITCEKAEPPI